MKQKIGILSLGCPRNLVDSEGLLGRLHFKGYQIVDLAQADVAIINSCSFIEEAKKESVDAILDLIALKKEGRLKKVIVYGCLSERYGKELRKELPEVDAFVGRLSLNHELKRYPLLPRHYVYLKICEGCINNCSFCVIPGIKGALRSLDMQSIINKVKDFDQDGVSEINVIGQDISGYATDLRGKPKLAEAVKMIERHAKRAGWIRLLYLNPLGISDELLSLIRGEEKICKYIDLPIQHINDRILRLMNRKTSRSAILRLIERIRKDIPGVALRSSLIVGFPSETKKEFKELLDFVKEARFERLGVFSYSREEGTPAYNFKRQIPQKLKHERFNLVMSCQQQISKEINNRFLGSKMRVLIDEKADGFYLARSQYDAPEVDGQVFVNSKEKLEPGDFVEVKITDTLEYDLVGEAIR